MAVANITNQQFENLFPFHFRTDYSGNVTHLGRSLQKIVGGSSMGLKFDDLFTILRPNSKVFGPGLLEHQGEMIVIDLKNGKGEMMGQILNIGEGQEFLFVVSLAVQEPSELSGLGLTFNDFAVHDPIFDYLMLLQTHRRAIEEAEELNRRLAEAHQVAVRASKLKSEFLANMSHELRTPMNGVLGMASILAESDLDDIQKECVDTILSSGDGMLTLVNDILDLSKIEAGHIVIEAFPFSLSEALRATYMTVKSQAEKKGLHLRMEVPSDLPDVLIGDENRVKQVLLNTLGNAIKFTDHGEVSCRVCIEDRDGFYWAEIEVKDTGIGMSEETLGKIFSPFVQGDSSMSKRFGGTGLGLSISRKLVEGMGGKIGVKSQLGVGSEFHFSIPFRKVN